MGWGWNSFGYIFRPSQCVLAQKKIFNFLCKLAQNRVSELRFSRFWPILAVFGTSRINEETYRPEIGNSFFGMCQGPTELYYSATWPPLDFRFSRKYTFSGQKSTQKSLRPIFDQKGLTNLGHNTRFFALYLGLKNATKKIWIGLELWTVKDFSSQKVDFARKTITNCQKLDRGHGYYGLCFRLLSTDPTKKIWKNLKIAACERFWSDPLVRPESP